MKNLTELTNPLVNNIEDYAIVVIDEKGKILQWNKGAEKIKGYTAKEIINKNYRVLFREEERKKLLPENLLKEAQKNGKAIYEGWKLKKDGTVFWANVVFTAVYNEENKLIGFTKIIKDLTEQRRQTDFQYNNLDALINNLQGLMWSVDRNCNLITSNKAFDELAKLYFGKVVAAGDHILSLKLVPDQLIRLKEYYKRAFKGETFSVKEYLPLPADAWFEVSFNPILNNNEIAGTACYAHNISEIKKVQDQLLGNEHKFRALIENSTDGVIIFSETMELQYISPSVISILGYTDKELKQINLFALFHPNDITPSQKIIENALSNLGQPIKGHLGQIRHKDGTWRWIDSIVTNLLNDPAVNGIVDNFWDVTESKLLYEKQEQAALRLKQAQALAHFGSWEFDLATRNFLCSDECCNIFGLQTSERRQSFDSWLAIVHPEDREYVIKTTLEARAKLSNWAFNYRVLRKDGSIRYVESTARYEYDNEKKLTGLYGAIHDFTDRKLAEEKEKASERKFRSLIENSNDGVAIISLDGKTTYVSPTVTKLLGYTIEEAMQMSLFSLMHVDDIPTSKEVFEKALANQGIPFPAPAARLKHKDGTWKWMEATITNMLHDPAINGFVDNFRDVNERVKVEQKSNRVNHLYSFISELSRVIIRNITEQNLLKTVCHLAVGFGKIDLAWVGLIDTEHHKINLITQYGMYPQDISLFQDLPYEDNGPQDFVAMNGDYYICNDVENAPGLEKWKDIASLRNWNSVMTLPIKKEGGIFATLNLYTSELDFFGKEEIILLKEAIHELSLALDVFEKEKHRQELEDKLKANLLRLGKAQEIANFGAYEIDFTNGEAIWSEQFCKIYGVSPDDNKHCFENWLSYVHPKDRERVTKLIKDANEQQININFYYRIIRRDACTRTIHSYRHMEFDEDGKATGAYAVAHDITDAMANIMHLKDQNKKLRDIAWIQSHKVRSPLATILGLTQLFQYEQSPDQVEQIIKGIVESTEKLDEVIHEITNKTADSEINQIYFPDVE